MALVGADEGMILVEDMFYLSLVFAFSGILLPLSRSSYPREPYQMRILSSGARYMPSPSRTP